MTDDPWVTLQATRTDFILGGQGHAIWTLDTLNSHKLKEELSQLNLIFDKRVSENWIIISLLRSIQSSNLEQVL